MIRLSFLKYYTQKQQVILVKPFKVYLSHNFIKKLFIKFDEFPPKFEREKENRVLNTYFNIIWMVKYLQYYEKIGLENVYALIIFMQYIKEP